MNPYGQPPPRWYPVPPPPPPPPDNYVRNGCIAIVFILGMPVLIIFILSTYLRVKREWNVPVKSATAQKATAEDEDDEPPATAQAPARGGTSASKKGAAPPAAAPKPKPQTTSTGKPPEKPAAPEPKAEPLPY